MKKKTSSEILNKYVNSGGKDATYDDVANAVKAERFFEQVNLWKKRLSIESFMLYVDYVVFGKDSVKQNSWTVILPDQSRVESVKEHSLLTDNQFKALFLFRALFVVISFLMKVLACVLALAGYLVMILGAYYLGIAYPIFKMIN